MSDSMCMKHITTYANALTMTQSIDFYTEVKVFVKVAGLIEPCKRVDSSRSVAYTHQFKKKREREEKH